MKRFLAKGGKDRNWYSRNYSKYIRWVQFRNSNYTSTNTKSRSTWSSNWCI
jgi:hypothetical protein